MYASCVVAGDVADKIMATNKNENSDEGCRMSTNYDPVEIFDCPLSDFCFHVASLKNLLYYNRGINVVWPPDSHDLLMEEATKSIPSTLFNFTVWILGFSVEPVEKKRY